MRAEIEIRNKTSYLPAPQLLSKFEIMTRVLFVCLGNICRSPTAEGVFRRALAKRELENRVHVDSAGTARWHVGSPPDDRAAAAAALRGIDLGGLRGRQVARKDMATFDFILAMDRENYAALLELSEPAYAHKIQLFLEYAADRPEEEVPDPYYGGAGGFDRVIDLIEEAAEGLLDHIERQWQAQR